MRWIWDPSKKGLPQVYRDRRCRNPWQWHRLPVTAQNFASKAYTYGTAVELTIFRRSKKSGKCINTPNVETSFESHRAVDSRSRRFRPRLITDEFSTEAADDEDVGRVALADPLRPIRGRSIASALSIAP